MVESPCLSVVLTTFNAEEHLHECVRSIFNQTFSDFELIVVDDGSTDNTVQIIESFEDDRIVLIDRSPPPNSIPASVNEGIRASTGDLIARHDADDLSDPTRFEKQVEFLDEHPDIALIGTGAHLIDQNGKKIGRRRVLTRPSFDDLLEHNEYIQGSTMMRRDAVEAVGLYDELFSVTEDYDLWLRLADQFSVRNIDKPLYQLRIHSGSVYEAKLKEIKLLRRYALMKATGRATGSLRRQIKTDGPHIIYNHLRQDEKIKHHLDISQELVRYGRHREARMHCSTLLSITKTHPSAYLIFFMTFLSPFLTQRIAQYYRKILNIRIFLRNII